MPSRRKAKCQGALPEEETVRVDWSALLLVRVESELEVADWNWKWRWALSEGWVLGEALQIW